MKVLYTAIFLTKHDVEIFAAISLKLYFLKHAKEKKRNKKL